MILDSFRALAALYVVAFHYFYRWTNSATEAPLVDAIPYVSTSEFIRHGYLGVELFFLISGFVIALTLTGTRSFSEFVVRRFARLFPAMFVCAIVTYLVVKLLNVEPLADVSMIDFIPSLTFVTPEVYNKLFGMDSDWISDVYWSLFVEVKFYFIAAVIYFFSPNMVHKKYVLAFCRTMFSLLGRCTI